MSTSMGRGRRGSITVVLALGLAVASPGSASLAAKGKAEFTTWDETFVDTSRPTEASEPELQSPDRTLVTTIYRPAGKGPFPLIVFSHGLSGHPEKFEELFAVWAAAGYIVAAPAFPLTNHDVPNSDAHIPDVAQQPTDVSFVLDEMLALEQDKKSDLYKAIDEEKIGTAGLSLGGATTYGVVFAPCCADSRFKAAAVLDGILLNVGDDAAEGRRPVLDGHIPLLIAHSDTDPAIPYAAARALFDTAVAPVWLVTFFGASHATQWEDDITSYDAIAERITLDFWDATLKGKPKALDRLERHATVEDLSAIESR